ncbi:MAG: glycosyl hydrolase 115 family protein [Muribaculaceae bacterium]|nr:glycosyl hydrolase 115 family protein [Muribaculaceae bacterium]
MRKILLLLIGVLTILPCAAEKAATGFLIAGGGKAAPIVISDNDWPGVGRAAADLADDVRKVTGISAELRTSDKASLPRKSGSVIAGTIGRSKLIDGLIAGGKLNVDSVRGKWESYVTDVIDGNLVIAGSDKRGTIYGIYDLSAIMGVSPWYFWADVPVEHKDRVEYTAGRVVTPSPKVKYRGIFINDEWPSFGGWCVNSFGGVNSKAYARMFELLLRLKANYLWPAMWDTAFNEDDPECPRLADEYGIVMGTSHHEPMMRAHKEYTRRDSIGAWDYASNPENIEKFFRYGIERNKNFDNIVTIGMRGDGDVAMGKGDDTDNMATLHNVIDAQRRILGDVYGRPDSVPQLWAIFTEVQRYYDAGFNVPDDVTLLFCDNNWGYIRRTAPAEEKGRKGGFGMYYHIDMNGGPWNDRWINTSPLPKLREQLNLAYKSGIDRIWIINVGDLKPKEIPIDFIMDYAWDPEKTGPGDEKRWLERWSARTFGEETAEEIADVLAKYPKYNLWRKPEVQTAGIFSVENYNEAARTDSLWVALEEKVESLSSRIAPEARDAFYQLVYYPAMASSGVARLYLAAEQNRFYASKGDIRANEYADLAKQLFARDARLTEIYNDSISGGKWRGMMQDKHIGYTQWFMPDDNIMPELQYVEPEAASRYEAAEPPMTEYAIAAHKYARNTGTDSMNWIFLPDLGRGEGCMGIDNVSAPSIEPGNAAPALEYDLNIAGGDSITFAIGILPTQDVNPARGLRLALQLDNGDLQVIDARRGLVDTFDEYTPANLKKSKKLKPLPPGGKMALNGHGRGMRNEVFDNLRWLDATFPVESAGRHTLKIIMVDPEIVLERIVVNPDNGRYSYFGPPEK